MRIRTVIALAVIAACTGGAAGQAAPSLDVCDTANCATVAVSMTGGNGRGTITSEPAGIACTVDIAVESGVCGYRFTWPSSVAALPVELTYTPAKGSEIHVLGTKNVPEFFKIGFAIPNGVTWEFDDRAQFFLTKHRVDVTVSGKGSGRVVLGSGSAECRKPCSYALNYGTPLELEAIPDRDAVFETWTGACKGQDSTCELTITEATATNAVFGLKDKSVEAQLVAVRAVTDKWGRRVHVRFALAEDLVVTLALGRNEKLLASKRFARVLEGERVLTLLVPRRVGRGPAKLRVELSDEAGNVRVLTRTVVIPKRKG